jgi:hypothetical protein
LIDAVEVLPAEHLPLPISPELAAYTIRGSKASAIGQKHGSPFSVFWFL